MLAGLQSKWLENHSEHIAIFEAAAAYFQGFEESHKHAIELLRSVVYKQEAPLVVLDASYLLAVLVEQDNPQEAARLYEQAIRLKDRLTLSQQDPDVQLHMRLTLARSYHNLSSIVRKRKTLEDTEEAETLLRRGMQIIDQDIDLAYAATQLRDMLDMLQKQEGTETGLPDSQIRQISQRISEIERPFRETSLEKVIQRPLDLYNLYYTISGLNHGLGYELQQIQVTIAGDGSASLTGTYVLTAMSMLSRIGTYLRTVPVYDAGVHFEGVTSLSPGYVLIPRREL